MTYSDAVEPIPTQPVRTPWPHRRTVRAVPEAGPLVAMIGGGQADRTGREHLFRRLQEAGVRVVVFDRSIPAAWQRPYLAGHKWVPAMNAATLTGAVGSFPEPVNGVLCWEDRHFTAAAAVADRLRLPGYGRTAATATRDRAVTHTLLEAAGCAVPRSVLAVDLTEAEEAAQGFGYPVVLKPRLRTAGFPARLAEDHGRLITGFAATAGAASATFGGRRGVLVEEHLDGQEIVAVCLTTDGVTQLVSVVRTRADFTPTAADLGHLVDANDPLLDEPTILHAANVSLRALGVQDGASQVVMRLTPSGPCVMAVKAGLHDLITRLVYLAADADLATAETMIACGAPVTVTPHRHHRVAAVTYLSAPAPGRVSQLELGAQLSDHVGRAAWLERLVLDVAPGSAVDPSPDGHTARIGLAVVTGRNRRECHERLDRLRRALKVTVVAADGSLTPAMSVSGSR
ncbi:ATP-binding protein [Acrocarpospora catenulata]|uniref:ATP-binding protein n=1 Tax=Acrocarpospora catenulata TaxID=2836182 RepID=UPI001BDA35F5|nr:hypothetical protein [Acrocarpospora catenulata]